MHCSPVLQASEDSTSGSEQALPHHSTGSHVSDTAASPSKRRRASAAPGSVPPSAGASSSCPSDSSSEDITAGAAHEDNTAGTAAEARRRCQTHAAQLRADMAALRSAAEAAGVQQRRLTLRWWELGVLAMTMGWRTEDQMASARIPACNDDALCARTQSCHAGRTCGANMC